jgi:hypothetical protein
MGDFHYTVRDAGGALVGVLACRDSLFQQEWHLRGDALRGVPEGTTFTFERGTGGADEVGRLAGRIRGLVRTHQPTEESVGGDPLDHVAGLLKAGRRSRRRQLDPGAVTLTAGGPVGVVLTAVGPGGGHHEAWCVSPELHRGRVAEFVMEVVAVVSDGGDGARAVRRAEGARPSGPAVVLRD